MGVLATLARRTETRALTESEWLLKALGGGMATYTGRTVNTVDALHYNPVYACVKIIAEDVASLPLITYRRVDGGRERAMDHRLYPILHDRPNPEMSSVEFRETLQGHLLLWGNAYAEIERDGAGRVVNLWPLRPDRMSVERMGDLVYTYVLPGGDRVRIPTVNVLHLRGLSSDGYVGYSPIALAREAVGLGLATEEYAARFFGNDARPGGVLQHPGKLSTDAATRLKASWEAAHRGLTNSQRVAVLEEGIEWKQVGMPARDAQFLETRMYQLRDVARIYRVPLHKLGDLERATFSNIEHQSREYVDSTLRPWLVRWEQRLNMALFSAQDAGRYYVEHLVDALLRGDLKSRYEAYAVGRTNGWLSADDIRELENMNPLPDGQGKLYLVPLNMAPADQVGQAPPSAPVAPAG